MQDIAIQTSARGDGGQVGGNGQGGGSSGSGNGGSGNGNGQGGGDGQGEIAGPGGQAALGAAVRMSSESLSMVMVGMLGAMVVLCTSVSW
jgi:hypothetical protein